MRNTGIQAADLQASAPPIGDPPPYNYDPNTHQQGRVAGLHLPPDQLLKPEEDNSTQPQTRIAYAYDVASNIEASVARTVDVRADSFFKDILLPLALILAEAAISSAKRYADDSKLQGSSRVKLI